MRQHQILRLALACAALTITLLALISCTPMSREESDRIQKNYNDFYNRTRGVPVRHVDT